LTFVVTLLLAASPALPAEVDRYAWEFPRVTGVTGADEMIQQLQEEVQKILDAGRLSPLRVYYADIPTAEQYWMYVEPGRIITTLAWAILSA
jgi:hypothetical protein